jgi:hypothetical protein
MRNRFTRLLTVATVCATAVGSLSGVASAAAGSGTYTKITSPSANLHFVWRASPATNTFPVSGTASNDVTSVDIDCLYTQGASVTAVTLASAVTVTAGSFSTTATIPAIQLQCRLRAIPTGESTTGYVSSYTGPLLYEDTLLPTADATPTTYGFTAVGEEGDGIAIVEDAGTCGVQALPTVATPSQKLGPVSHTCSFALPSGNIDPSGTSTKSAVLVSGHNAYLPAAVHSYLIGSRSLAVTQSTLTVSKTIASSGDITVTESAPLMRCSVSDLYPPTSASCPNLIATGVTLQRVSTFFRSHQVRVRDAFTSTDAVAHSVSLEYQGTTIPQPTGKTGFSYPTHAGSFTAPTLNQSVTGFGTKAGTMLIRSDIYAASNDPAADTVGVTWGRPPSVVKFAQSATNLYGLRYALSVPANGKAFLGFALSESIATSATQALGALAVADMVNVPAITSPLANASVPTQSTTVKGSVTAGANGLPTSVLVNGHAATIHKTSATAATYAVTFSEAWGKHTITVVAKDVVGNTRSKAITVTNTPALVFNGAAHRSGSHLSIPLACKSFSASTCYGKVTVKNSSGTTIGTSAVFSIARGSSKTVVVTLSPISSSIRVYLYQKEPNGTYPLASSKAFSV